MAGASHNVEGTHVNSYLLHTTTKAAWVLHLNLMYCDSICFPDKVMKRPHYWSANQKFVLHKGEAMD